MDSPNDGKRRRSLASSLGLAPDPPPGTPPRKGLCGCWITPNTRPGLDLRGTFHGWPGHDRHAGAVHAWCYLCCPNCEMARPDGDRGDDAPSSPWGE